jgi:putative peptidoglycan lipid II flippase
VGIAILLSILFSNAFPAIGWMPHGGLALGTTIASIVETSILIFLLHRKLGGLLDSAAWSSAGRTILASAVMAAALLVWRPISANTSAVFTALGGFGVGIFVYAAATWLVGSPEAKTLIRIFLQRLQISDTHSAQ